MVLANRKYGWVLAAMVAVLLLASFWYLYGLNNVSFWEDESWMAIAIRGDLPGVWTFAAEKGVHPPLYFLLTWVYARFAGDGELALRWFSGLWALVGIALTYRVGADLYGRKAGFFAALLVTGSLFLAYFARIARHYSAFFTLAVALIWAYEYWRRHPDSNRRLLAIILLQAALLYTHYFGAWMAVVIGLHYLLSPSVAKSPLHAMGRGFRGGDKFRHWLRLIIALAISGVLFLPWIPSLIGQFSGSRTGLGYAITEEDWALKSYLDTIFNASYPLSLALLAVGIYATWRLRKFSAGLLLGLWIVLPTLLSLAVNERFQWFIARNMLFTLGGVMILFGAGLGWLATQRIGRIVAVVTALVFVIVGMVTYDAFWWFITPNWRDAAREIATDVRPDDMIVLRAEPYSLDYYLYRYTGHDFDFIPTFDWLQNPVSPGRIWQIDGDWAVRFEAIEALEPDMRLTHRPVVLPIVAELYERPPEAVITSFGETFELGSTNPLETLQIRPAETLILDLWWRAIKPPDFDYSVGVYLVAPDGQVIAQTDGAFDKGRINATALTVGEWQPDARTLSIPENAASGEYTLLVSVYDWRDNSRLTPENGREDGLFVVGTVEVIP